MPSSISHRAQDPTTRFATVGDQKILFPPNIERVLRADPLAGRAREKTIQTRGLEPLRSRGQAEFHAGDHCLRRSRPLDN